MDGEGGRATALCWVSSDGDIGPAVAEGPRTLVPVVLTALDRVAKTQEPESLGVFCTTASLVAAATGCAGSASASLAELGDVLGAAARPRPLPADPPAPPALKRCALCQTSRPWVKWPRMSVAS